MNRKTVMTITIAVMAAVLVLLVVLRLTDSIDVNSGVRIGSVGNSTMHKFNASYVEIKGKFSHTLSPSKNSDTLHCKITTDSGSIHVTVTERSGGDVILDKEISENAEFDLTASGKVRVKLETSGHSGSYSFEY